MHGENRLKQRLELVLLRSLQPPLNPLSSFSCLSITPTSINPSSPLLFPPVIPPSRFLLGYWSWTWFNQSCWWRKHFLLKREKWKQRHAASEKVGNNSLDSNQGMQWKTTGAYYPHNFYFIINLRLKRPYVSGLHYEVLCIYWDCLVLFIYFKVSFIVIYLLAEQNENENVVYGTPSACRSTWISTVAHCHRL